MPGEVHRISIPATQPSPLATGPKMISHGAHASQRRLPGGGARWRIAWKSRLVPFVEDLVDGVAETPPLFLEAGEG
jgi:hypothetical protein